jgi:hypothetical protein
VPDDPTPPTPPEQPGDAPLPGSPEPSPGDPVARADDGTPLDETGRVLASRVEPVVIEDEMRSSYLDYAMSVIVGRALPDVRDGMKPVHRRILFSMDESGLRPDRPYRKCAAAVGEVMKKYHPHGDSSIYDALVRMAQDFSIRYELIDGHGNFGSIDGDPAAAMRYTESRLSRLAMELLRDIDEETVDFVPNYDGYEEEPTVLPARFPALLANGATGIAVGMATNIPPHNLRELIDATVALIDDPSLTSADLMRYLPAPDFPTGALILGQAGAYDAYTTGRGSVKVRAVCTIEEPAAGSQRERIVVTEIPYMVNKTTLLQKIAQLVDSKVISGISDLNDESSSRRGMRIVIELKRDANAQVVLNQLYKHTQLQDTFGVNLLALVDGVPRTLTLDQALTHYVAHQVDVIERRTRYRLRKAQERAHVLEGLLIALDHIDEIIAIIRGSASADVARGTLMERFTLSEIQASAILDMQLRRLAALERQRIQDEYDELQLLIAELEAILADPERVKAIIKDELGEIREKYGDERRTRIVPDEGAMTVEDLIPESDVVLTLSRDGYVKRTPIDAFRTQKRGGRGRPWRGDEGGRHRVDPPDLLHPRPPAGVHQPGPRLPHQGLPGPREVPVGQGRVRRQRARPRARGRGAGRGHPLDPRPRRPGPVPGLRDASGHGQAHPPRRVRLAAQRPDRDQPRRGRRADRRRGHRRLPARDARLATRVRHPLRRGGRPRHGPDRRRRPGHAAQGRRRRGALDEHRRRRGERRGHLPARRHRPRLRQAHPAVGLPLAGSRWAGGQDGQADREARRSGRCARRALRGRGAARQRQRRRHPHGAGRRQPPRPGHPGRPADEARRGLVGGRRGPRGRGRRRRRCRRRRRATVRATSLRPTVPGTRRRPPVTAADDVDPVGAGDAAGDAPDRGDDQA